MSTQYLTVAERLAAAQAALEEVTYELAVTCSDAHYLVAELAQAVADAGITRETHPRIAACVKMLRRLLADHAGELDDNVARMTEITERLKDRRDLSEE